ncbi:hypothetical protein M406DRAFT_267438 [Cryphonectria parasitica EP155]|uniref:Zn(2)-C6 fungal-type domain-containing protein n=1 Tax=Cryphonectria parasitica (strain ATCC 38755 / EP155) TaxID=660469 RepID=A0A9P4XU60_CRYP1|nr:uncharacterized protein M406DRAFT_267438 [Cryphonectria parasitica EP155]KAF3760886.1 hypothetical protein M406DRAFT_267438 [Cryphonectria parasitica EP155]
MSDRRAEGSEPPAKRRKVRKGTRSCWECKRRKIKCQFDAPDDAVCIGCKQRGTICRSQEYDDENAPEPGQKSDPPLARRLDRLEQMMERIVDKISVHRRGPSESGHIPTPAMTSIESSTPTLPTTAASQGPASRPATSAGPQLLPPLNQHYWVCNSLRSVVPPQAVVDAIISASPGALYAVSMCYSDAERCAGRAETTASLAVSPPMTAHALILAKRALQILICVQQLPPAYDWDALGPSAPITDTMSRLLNGATLVTSNDELMGYAEGIECLLLQASYQANCGNLRRAWITTRRALGLAQMMGLDKKHTAAFRSCDPSTSPARRTSPHVLWVKVVSWDRYLSLLLGLSLGSRGNEFGSEKASEEDTPIDRLEKAHSLISERISERNDKHQRDPSRHQSIYALTQDIDLELEAAASAMPPGWWDEPRLDPFASQVSMWDATAKVLFQIHHFTLVLLLHVPYMLRDLASPRYDYSKTTCVATARDLLSRFFSFRTHNVSAYSCRRVDYAGLIAAMTLCLSYLGRRRTETWVRSRLSDDSELIELTRRRMEHVARVNGDRLSKEAVGIIGQLAPIIQKATAALQGPTEAEAPPSPEAVAKDLQFNIPYLGSVNIKIPGSTTYSYTADWHGHRRHPSSATSALDRMALSPTQQQVSASLEAPQSSFSDIGFMQFAQYDNQLPFGTGPSLGAEPDFMAGADDWALQGVDAAYWSLFEGIM